MKVKHSIFPFIPVALAMMFLKLMSIFGKDENEKFLGLTEMNLSYTIIGIAVALFAVCILINLFDRKTSPVYPVHKNPAAGVLSVLSGFAIVGSAVTNYLIPATNTDYQYMTIATLVISIPAAIAMFLMSKVHFVGKTTVSNISMLFIFPSLWGCAELVSAFLEATRESIINAESESMISYMFCYIFITLFLFSNSMVLSRVKGRNPVKGNFIYGLPAAALGLSQGAFMIIKFLRENVSDVDQYQYKNLMIGVVLVLTALYALSFLIEMTVKSYTKDEIEVIDGIPDEESVQTKEDTENYVDTKDYEDLVFLHNDPESEQDNVVSDNYYNRINDFDDFITGYDDSDSNMVTEQGKPIMREEDVAKSDNKTASYISPVTDEIVISNKIVSPETPQPKAEPEKKAEEKPKAEVKEEPKEELSEIDKILQELESKR